MAAVVRGFVERGVKEKKAQKNGADMLIKMAKRAKRLKVSGPKDLAINHDYYLYGEGRKD